MIHRFGLDQSVLDIDGHTRLRDELALRNIGLPTVPIMLTETDEIQVERTETINLEPETENNSQMLQPVVSQERVDTDGSTPTVSPAPKKKKRDLLFDMLADDLPPNPHGSADSEISAYLSEERSAKNTCPLEYWKSSENKFPRLAKLAKVYLAIPASSGSVERLFSIAGSIGRSRRSKLSVQYLERLLMYRENRLRGRSMNW